MRPPRKTREERIAEHEARKAERIAFRAMSPEERRAVRVAQREAYFAQRAQRRQERLDANT
jgi:hypothetical protein